MYILLLFCVLLGSTERAVYFLSLLAFFLISPCGDEPLHKLFEGSCFLVLYFFPFFFFLILFLHPSPFPPFVSHWVDEYLIHCYFGDICFHRHPFTHVVIAWLHLLKTPENHRNHRQKSQQQQEAVFLLPCLHRSLPVLATTQGWIQGW